MGYTHYYRQKRSFTKREWAELTVKINKILDYCGPFVELQLEYYRPRPPCVNGSTVRFNGADDDGHETFVLTKAKRKLESWESPDPSGVFNFCKTARKPYDFAVCLCLLATPKDVIKLSSDGNWNEEWAEPRKAYKKIFGTEPENSFS